MDAASHLSLVLDLSPVQWARAADDGAADGSPLPLRSFLSQLLAFVNSHLAGKDENTLAVFGAFPAKSVMLYSSADPATSGAPAPDANSYQPFKVVDATIVNRIVEEVEALPPLENEEPVALVGALMKAMCYINRVASRGAEDPTPAPEPRILVLSVSPDEPSSYIPTMNAIFSAQKLKVSIDVCQLFGPETVFLQQAAYLTGGAYVHLTSRDAVLQYLIMSFLPPTAIRTLVAVPTQDAVDLRASCFCHKRVADIGYVCSVCLSIFCQPVPVCSTCKTKFPLKTLQRLNTSRSSAPASPAGTAAPPRAANALPSANSIGANGTNGATNGRAR